MNGNILVLMPFFMEYHIKMSDVLSQNYTVTLINSDIFDKKIANRYCTCSKIRWGIRHILKVVANGDLEKIQNYYLVDISKSVSFEFNAYDYVLCINGAYLPNKLFEILKRNNPKGKFIYYAWDDLANLLKNTQINFFDYKYSFNINDCKKNDMIYLPMFVQEKEEGHAERNLYDLAFIASVHSGREKIADNLYKRYGSKYRLYIYLYDSEMSSGSRFAHNTPLSYNEYINVLRGSKVILDVPHNKQNGPTTRAFDALVTKTKVITTNIHMMEYPVWSKNILYTNIDEINIDENFMLTEYSDSGYKALQISDWLEKIGL